VISRRKAADALIATLSLALRDATEQLSEAVDIMLECPNCSQHVHRKDAEGGAEGASDG
jgi:hypothetical protein